MKVEPFDYLKRIRGGTILTAAAAAILSKFLLKASLVPDQHDWLGDAGALVAMAVLLVVPLIQPSAIRYLFIAVMAALILLAIIRTAWFEEIPIGGHDRLYIVGTSLTETGRTMERNCLGGEKNLGSLPQYELIRCAGPAAIPALYGATYTAVSIVYVLSYLVIFGTFVALVGHRLRPGVVRLTIPPKKHPKAGLILEPSPPAAVRMRNWDVFISHASEDKVEIARPLADALQEKGLAVWYDEFSLRIGDSLREKIDYGLANSRFGIVILSPHFLEKHWPVQELNGLASREVEGKKVILPIWHNVRFEEVRRFSPILADRMAAKSEEGLESVVAKLLEVLG